jgi:hypothetical protein
MPSMAAPGYWDEMGLIKLLIGLFAGPLAWGVNLEVNYSLVKWACESGHVAVLTLVSCMALVVVTAGGRLSWRGWTRLRRDADPRGCRAIDRSYFLAVAGLALNALFALLILTGASLHAVVRPCQ